MTTSDGLLATDVPDLGTVLRRIELVNRNWPGIGLDRMGSARGVNLEGDAEPLYWVFNTAAELPGLLAALSPRQPIVGMRSLNQIVSPETRGRCDIMDVIAHHYAELLLERFGTRPCIVGGNCQAAEIAWRVASRLIMAGAPVRHVLAVDARIPFPLPVPVRMIFGSASKWNVLDWPDKAKASRLRRFWESIVQALDISVIPGGHGQYFHAGNVRALAECILAPVPTSKARPAGAASDWRIVGRTDNDIELSVAYRRFAPLPTLALLMWRNGETPSLADPTAASIQGWRTWRGSVRYRFNLPQGDETGWDVRPILCIRGVGPLNWPLSEQPVLRL